MKKKGSSGLGMAIPKRMRIAGITFFLRNGQLIGRESYTHEKRSNTLPQFIQRQKMRHTTALWKMLRFCDVMFTERRTAYQNFASLANQLPVVFVPDDMNQASFLMPDIPVSDGILPMVKLQLGEVNGTPALLTNLKVEDRTRHAKLRLYTALQTIENKILPRVRFRMREISWWDDMTVVDEHLALVGEEFADEMKGWALVKVVDDRCSPQTIVTRCTVYQQYTTEDALETAADSYGGLTETPFLSPR